MDVITYASLQVVIDGQAWLYAVLLKGGDAPEEEFKAAMLEYKEETETLINQRVTELLAEAAAEEEE